MDSLRPDVVYDCNVFVQAIIRASGPAAAALRLVERNAVRLHVNRPILRELRRTLAYPELRQKNPNITYAIVEDYLDHIAFRGVVHRDVAHVFEHPWDADDEIYVDLAAAVDANYLVTRDNDLLSLATDHSVAAKQFRQRFPSLRVVTPVELLHAV
jgi:putative PIN family toxin of toxin-antitoxin system